jgi:predicted transporter
VAAVGSTPRDTNTMMMLIHLVMFGFLIGVGLCAAHFGMRRWAEARDVGCPWGKLAHASSHVARLGAVGAGVYALASVGWAAIPAAMVGFFLTWPPLAMSGLRAPRQNHV